jgi:hypothetical protein
MYVKLIQDAENGNRGGEGNEDVAVLVVTYYEQAGTAL